MDPAQNLDMAALAALLSCVYPAYRSSSFMSIDLTSRIRPGDRKVRLHEVVLR